MTCVAKLVSGTLGLVACSANQQPQDAATVDGSTARSLTVNVVREADGVPLESAAVLLELHGSRVEATTGGDGRVVFEDLEFAGGTASVTAVANGLRVISRLGIEGRQAFVELRAGPVANEVTTVRLEGTAQGMVDVANYLIVSTTVEGTRHGSPEGPGYALEVATGQPMTLVAIEAQGVGWVEGWGRWSEMVDVVRWALQDHAAVKTPSVIDIDLTLGATTPESFAGTMILPRNQDSRFRRTEDGYDAWAEVRVGRPNLPLQLGVTEWVEPTVAGDRASYAGEYVMLSGFEAVTTYQLGGEFLDESPDWWSTVLAHGYPEDGALVEFLDAPEVTSASERHPLRDLITWTSYDASTAIILQISTGTGRIWDVIAPGDAESLTIPSLPSTVDEEKVLGAGPWEARVVLCEVDESLGCTRSAESQAIELVP